MYIISSNLKLVKDEKKPQIKAQINPAQRQYTKVNNFGIIVIVTCLLYHSL